MSMNAKLVSLKIKAQDETKGALSGVASNLKKLLPIIAGVAAAVGGLKTAFDVMKESASLMEMTNLGVSIENAYKFTEALKMSGMEVSNVTAMFQNLAEKISEGANSEAKDLHQTFENLGVTFTDLKNKKVDEIFEQIYQSAGKIEDKTKALAELKKIFGGEGIILFNNVQDTRMQRIIKRTEEVAAAMSVTAKQSNLLFDNMKEVEGIFKSGFHNFLAPILPTINTLIELFIKWKDEGSEIVDEMTVLNRADFFRDLIVNTLELQSTLIKVFQKIINLTMLVGNSIELVVESIKSIFKILYHVVVTVFKDIANVTANVFKGMKSAITGNFDDAWNYLKKALNDPVDFSGLNNSAKESSEKIKNAFSSIKTEFNELFSWDSEGRNDEAIKAFKEEYNRTIASMKDTKSTANISRTGTGAGADTFNAVIAETVKRLQLLAEQQKMNLDFEQQWNEFYYSTGVKGLEEYYNTKVKLSNETYQIEIKNLEAERAKKMEIEAKSTGVDKLKSSNEVLTMTLKIEQTKQKYMLDTAKLEDEIASARISKAEEEFNFKRTMFNLEKELNAVKNDFNTSTLEKNNAILETRQKELELLREQKELYEDLLAMQPDNNALKAALMEAKIEYEKTANELDPISQKVHSTIQGGLEDGIKDLMAGTKKGKDIIKDFLQSILNSVQALVAKQLSNDIMNSIMPKNGAGGAGGIGGFFSKILRSFIDADTIGGKANGGFLHAGELSRVNERGDEFFQPSSSGTVITNEQVRRAIGGGGGGSGGSPIINIYAQDVDSFAMSKDQVATQVSSMMSRANSRYR